MEPLQQRTSAQLNLPSPKYLSAQQLIHKFQLKSPTRPAPLVPTLTLQLNFKPNSKESPRCTSPPVVTPKHTQADKKELFKSSLYKAVHQLNSKVENRPTKPSKIPVKQAVNKSRSSSKVKGLSSPKMSSRLVSSGCMSMASISLESTTKNTGKESQRGVVVPRKHSTASTEARSRHAVSQQVEDESSQSLFAQRMSQSSQLGSRSEVVPNMVEMLEQAKKRLYHQIYSLDQKLMVDSQITSCSKKQIVINLRKGTKAARSVRASE